ncbi:hypothetical protein KIPB_010167 [Kipferlia bialata]|uniref:Uncharacterized protein n=1 Tax=Kipferlia bialata TaxID=797122 RepID=A0A9K3D424_9EUKA|nr:hypothetical protein KIPB_010167 [Kipferlia bialata]|eukprot:g10167.t1
MSLNFRAFNGLEGDISPLAQGGGGGDEGERGERAEGDLGQEGEGVFDDGYEGYDDEEAYLQSLPPLDETETGSGGYGRARSTSLGGTPLEIKVRALLSRVGYANASDSDWGWMVEGERERDPDHVAQALERLSILAAEAPNKQIMYEMGCGRSAIEAMREYTASRLVCKYGAGVLANMGFSDPIKAGLVSLGAVPALLMCLDTHSKDSEVCMWAVGALLNMAFTASTRPVMIEHGVCKAVRHIMQCQTDSKQISAWGQSLCQTLESEAEGE